MEKDLYLKAMDVLIYNKNLQFEEIRKLSRDIIDSYNLNKYISDIIINTDYNIAGYDVRNKKIYINFDNIKSETERLINNIDDVESAILIKIANYYDTIIHEIRHAKQQQMVNEDDLLLSKVYHDTVNNINVYTFLHDYCPLETDANFEATLQTDNLLYHTNNIDNKLSLERVSNYIIENLLGMYFNETGIIVPSEVFYEFLQDRSFHDLVRTLDLSLEQRLRYGLYITNDEIRNMLASKNEGKQLKKILLTS